MNPGPRVTLKTTSMLRCEQSANGRRHLPTRAALQYGGWVFQSEEARASSGDPTNR